MRLFTPLIMLAIACTYLPPTTTDEASGDTDAATPPTVVDTGDLGVQEVCNGLDDNGNGQVDEGLPQQTYYPDADGDGYGDDRGALQACEAPDGYVLQGGDCRDDDMFVRPGILDQCDGLDSDCDGVRDEDHRRDWNLATLNDDGAIWHIDPWNAEETLIQAMVGEGRSAIHSADALEATFIIATGNSQVMQLDACTGELDVLSNSQARLPGIAFIPGDAMYAIDTNLDAILEVDPFTGVSSEIYALGNDVHNSGMAYDCSDHRIYIVNSRDNTVTVFNPDTWTIVDSWDSGVPFDAVGLEFEVATRTLWASTGSALWAIDVDRKTSTRIGALDNHTNDLLMLPDCP